MLSPKRQKFVDEFLKDRDPAAAYVRAGYSEKGAAKGAHRLLKNVEIQSKIVAGTEQSSAVAGLDVARVLKGLEAETDSDSPAARVRAWELLGKHLGMFPNKHEHTGEVKVSGPVKIEMEVVEDVRKKNPAASNAG